jgi:hypothetical protein
MNCLYRMNDEGTPKQILQYKLRRRREQKKLGMM